MSLILDCLPSGYLCESLSELKELRGNLSVGDYFTLRLPSDSFSFHKKYYPVISIDICITQELINMANGE